MRKKRSMVRARTGLEIADWKLRFLLDGTMPQPQEMGNVFEAFSFMFSLPNEPCTRHGNTTPWFELWPEIKNEAVVKEWRKTHGRAFAETELRRFNMR